MEYLWAFLIGGLFCAVGQILIDYTKLTPARILVSYVVIGVIISAFGWYKPLVEFAGGAAAGGIQRSASFEKEWNTIYAERKVINVFKKYRGAGL